MSEQHSKHEQLAVGHDQDRREALICNFTAHLRARGHSDGTLHSYRSALLHFLYWLAEEFPESQAIDSRTVRTFLQEHLPNCHCPPPVYKALKTVRAALNQLLLMLGQDRLQPPYSMTSAAIEDSLHQFDDFQRDVCGLTESTRWNRQRWIRTFLVALFGTAPIDPQRITVKALVNFVSNEATSLKPSSVGGLLSALRSYLRFLQLKGDSNVALIAAVPSPPNWSLAMLPPSLSDAEMDKFWATFDISMPIGKRDYAMARCLADLGLRCHEVTSMRIDAIDWRRGIIHLDHSKSRREELLPLPDITGLAVVDYLRNGRPATTTRSIFVYHRAPMGQGVANTTVRGAIRRAFARANLPWTGTHILRHTAATRMVQGGATLKEVADVLRHRSIDTTQIYTKVNLPELQHVAMPWPGRQS